MKNVATNQLAKIWAWVLTLGGGAGMVAMTWQATERIQMLKNPGGILSCNLNPIVDCGTVLGNRWAALFGFPNAFIGMIVFAMLALSGLYMLLGTKPNKAYRNVVLALALILLGFSVWFFGMSLYVIGKICIFCLVGWIVSIPIFVYTVANWREAAASKLSTFFQKNHLNLIIASYVVMFALFLLRFSDYYFG